MPLDDAPSELPSDPGFRRRAWQIAGASWLVALVNFGVWSLWADDPRSDALGLGFTVMAVVQFGLAVAGIVFAVRAMRAKTGGAGPLVVSILGMLGAPLGWFAGAAGIALQGMGGAWGRPLRIRGRQLHPNLREGSDWTRGERPDASALDLPTRRALAALWLHDAQKEHASVPAFSRISWMLAAVGAPAELMEGAHRAAMEEIEHTRLCFALAAGYEGRSHSVDAMPELLLGMDFGDDPLVTLAVESLEDGCLLEDYNADVAAACVEVCREPVTRGVLQTIAVEERSHADFSWALLEWLLERDAARVVPALERARTKLHAYPRPTAVSGEKQALIDRADADALLAHGRLPDARWAELWNQRLAQTLERLETLVSARHAA